VSVPVRCDSAIQSVKDKTLLVGGHSLGGALSLFMTMYLWKVLIPPRRGKWVGAVYPCQRVGATSPSRRGDGRSEHLKAVSLSLSLEGL
jgi:hypothetical protein